MATASPDFSAGTPWPARLWRRLVDLRWMVAGFLAVLAVLALAGALAWPAAALGAAAALIIAATAPTLDKRTGSVTDPAPVHPAVPDTRRVADALPDPCLILDRRGTVRHANQQALRAFPVRIGEPFSFRLRVPDLVAAFEGVAKGGPPAAVEFGERVPTERWFSAWFAPIAGTDDILLTIDDLSERRNADRVRVDFVANASHELRTPLASLAGFIETLQGPARDDVAARERFLKIMQDQAERMSRLVNDLLSLSRIEMKQHVRPSDPVDLVLVVREVAAALEPQAHDLGVAIELELPDGPVVVEGDRDELVQVFENLIENAAKYGQAGGRVAASVAVVDGRPTVTVRDFGPGIPAADIPRLTERFYRVDVEASRKHRGTGLGLAIVKHIVARHRAQLTIDSRLGEGAAFRVGFPQPGKPKAG